MKKIMILLLLCITAAYSCKMGSLPGNRGTGSTPQSGKPNSLTVNILDGTQNSSRTVVADISGQITEWKIDLVSNDGFAAKTKQVTAFPTTFANVEPGSWDITITGMAGTTALAAGTDSFTMKLGETHLCSVTVNPFQNNTTPASATGSFSLTTSFPNGAGITSVTATLDGTALGGLSIQVSPLDGSRRQVTFAKSAVPSGEHELVFTMLRAGGKTAGVFRESVNIWDNCVSDKWMGATALETERKLANADFFESGATLGDVTLFGITLSGFYSNTGTYNLGVCQNDSIRFTATKLVDGQSIRYSWNNGATIDILSGQTSPALSLTDGPASNGTNTLVITVTAPDRSSTGQYTINMDKGYHFTYHGNSATGGAAPTDSNAYGYNQPAVVKGNTGTLVNTNQPDGLPLHFEGWKTASGTLYNPGSTIYALTSNLDLYAFWSAAGNVSSTGGLIFYDKGVDTNGWRYLEAAPANWNSGSPDPLSIWSNVTASSGATAYPIGWGKFNTEYIIRQNDYSTSAAKVCKEYGFSVGGIYYNDWFLPSQEEAGLIQAKLGDTAAKRTLYGIKTGEYYWTSTENGANAASSRYLSSNTGNVTVKNVSYSVRPIRAFRSNTDNQKLYTVTYYANGADGDVPVDQQYYQAGEMMTVLSPDDLYKDGMTFSFWTTSPVDQLDIEDPGDVWSVTGDLAFYALWN